jgi:surface protein
MQTPESKLVIENNKDLVDKVKRYLEEENSDLPDMSLWDVSKITDMSELFRDKIITEEANQRIKGISEWNVENVIYMSFMFENCTAFNQNLSKWKLIEARDLSGMFQMCKNYNLPIFKLNKDNKVTHTESMFLGCTIFNQDISNWDVSNVQDMRNMFENCTAFNQDLSRWELKKDSKVYTDNMFKGCLIWEIYKPIPLQLQQVPEIWKLLLDRYADYIPDTPLNPHLPKALQKRPLGNIDREDQYNPLNSDIPKTIPIEPSDLQEPIHKIERDVQHRHLPLVVQDLQKIISNLNHSLSMLQKTHSFSEESDIKYFKTTCIKKIKEFILSLLPISHLVGKRHDGGKRHKHLYRGKGYTKRNVDMKGGLFGWFQSREEKNKKKLAEEKQIQEIRDRIVKNQCINYDDLNKCNRIRYYVFNRKDCRLKYQAAKPYLQPTVSRPAIKTQCDKKFLDFRNQLLESLYPLKSYIHKHAELQPWNESIQQLYQLIDDTNQENMRDQITKIRLVPSPAVQSPTAIKNAGGSVTKRNKRYKKGTRRLHRKTCRRRRSVTHRRR